MAHDYKRIFIVRDIEAAKKDKPYGAELRPSRQGIENEYVIEGSSHDKHAIDNFVRRHKEA